MIYDKEHTRELIFPVGGIGTGSIGFAGNGMLKDWEIFNRPAKGSLNGCSHLALRMETAEGVQVKVLNGDQEKDLMGQYGTHYDFDGYGYGPNASTMAGYDHFSEWSFDGAFPMSELRLSDPGFPAEVSISAWNPMIPNDSENSSIPAAFFDITIRNTGAVSADFTAAFSLRNPYNEIECGNNYARSMASFALLMIDNGFIFDLPNRMIGFDPQKDAVCGKAFASIWSLDGAWGTMEVNGNETVITVKEGALRANKLKLPYIDMVETVLVNGTPVDFTFENGITRLTEDLSTVNAVEIHVIRALV